MTKRVCENCRWFVSSGLCFRYPKENTTGPDATCGEWADASITPEQEDLQKLTRQFAVALAAASWTDPHRVWELAEKLAAAEPQIQREGGK